MTNTPDHPAPAAELDPASLAAIQDLLKAEATAPKEPKAEPVQHAEPARVVQPRKGTAALPPLEEAPASPKRATKKPSRPGITARAWARLIGYRPTTRHIVLACLALLVLFRPWLVVGVLLLTVFLILGVFLALGYDGFWRRGMAIGRWYAGRRPERAADLHNRLDAFAMKWDAILDRFPEGTVDGLYLPDFGEMAAADARHDAAMARRFDSLRNSEG